MDIGKAILTEALLLVEEPEVIIRPSVPALSLTEQVDVAEIARLGEEATKLVIPELIQATHWIAALKRRLFPKQSVQIRPPNSADFQHNCVENPVQELETDTGG